MKTKENMIDDQTCPVCHHKLNCMTGAADHTPAEGDYSVCAYCGALLVMDANIRSVAMSEDEVEVLRYLSPETWEDLGKIREGLRDLFQPNAGVA